MLRDTRPVLGLDVPGFILKALINLLVRAFSFV
jgi:hypothetical protein